MKFTSCFLAIYFYNCIISYSL